MQITPLMFPDKIFQHNKPIEWILILTTSCVLIITSVPWILSVNLSYYTRIETATKIIRNLYYCQVGLGLALVVSFVVAIVFLASFGYQSELAPVIVVVSIFRILWSALLSYCYWTTRRAATNCKVQMIVYHDFLIEYRQTPRSKILRKHLPSMEAVVEEESRYEQSALSVYSPREINSLTNSRRDPPSQVFEFKEIDVHLSGMGSSDEESWEIVSPILDLSNTRLTNSLNQESEERTENSDVYEFAAK